MLRINAKLSTIFYSETNGQSKNANQEIKRHLCSYINYFQDDWIELLSIAEFSENANTSATTKIFLFLTLQNMVSQMSFDSVNLSILLTRKQLANATAKSIAN